MRADTIVLGHSKIGPLVEKQGTGAKQLVFAKNQGKRYNSYCILRSITQCFGYNVIMACGFILIPSNKCCHIVAFRYPASNYLLRLCDTEHWYSTCYPLRCFNFDGKCMHGLSYSWAA